LEPLHRPAKIIFICEVAMDAGEADVRNPVKLPESVHRQFTDQGARHFAPTPSEEILFDIVNDLVDGPSGHRTSGAGEPNPVEQFLSIELLDAPAALRNHQRRRLGLLDGAVSILATEALASSPDTLIRVPSVQNPRLIVSAVRATHPNSAPSVALDSFATPTCWVNDVK
jgi:hypothetical protein